MGLPWTALLAVCVQDGQWLVAKMFSLLDVHSYSSEQTLVSEQLVVGIIMQYAIPRKLSGVCSKLPMRVCLLSQKVSPLGQGIQNNCIR